MDFFSRRNQHSKTWLNAKWLEEDQTLKTKLRPYNLKSPKYRHAIQLSATKAKLLKNAPTPDSNEEFAIRPGDDADSKSKAVMDITSDAEKPMKLTATTLPRMKREFHLSKGGNGNVQTDYGWHNPNSQVNISGSTKEKEKRTKRQYATDAMSAYGLPTMGKGEPNRDSVNIMLSEKRSTVKDSLKLKRYSDLASSQEKLETKRYDDVDRLMRKSKPNSFITSKILMPERGIQRRLEMLDGLFGNSQDAEMIKSKFVKMAILPNKGLVYGRQIGNIRSESTLSRGSTDNLVATTGSAEANRDPVGSVKRIISREKPDMSRAT